MKLSKSSSDEGESRSPKARFSNRSKQGEYEL